MTPDLDIQKALKPPIFKQIGEVAEKLDTRAYVIGGYVRDVILKRKAPKDVDIVCEGSGIALAKAVSKSLDNTSKVQVFKNFGTAMLKVGEWELEFVGARKESYRSDSRKPIVENGTLEDDQKRRDFTVNALAVALNPDEFGHFIDPFNGLKDMENQLLRTPLEPEQTYTDDPLRMLRAVRFAAQLNFKIESTSLKAISKLNDRLDILSKERIVDELHKLMKTQKPSIGFLLLEKTGLLKPILPELIALKGIEEVEGQRHKDNFYHTLEVVDNICKTTDNLWLRWAALLHDIGKAPTKKFSKKVGWTFHGHEFVGAKMVYKLFKRLKMPLNDKMKYVQKLVFMSSRPIAVSEDMATDAAVRRLVFDAGDHIDDLLTLCQADITTKNPRRFKKYHENFEKVRQKIIDVEERDRIRNFQPPVDGAEIMRTFGLQPCREIGILKEYIKEAILEGKIPNEYKAAHALMLEKAAELGLQTTSS
ncbi:MAG: CCA tRNA nucleotidyltransferase [Flavobacteriaceae bacterium]